MHDWLPSSAWVCGRDVATVYKGGVGHTSSGLPATDETATSYASAGQTPYLAMHLMAQVSALCVDGACCCCGPSQRSC